ncbi:unnamed protein product [Dicrocoelium dendriticum]|nr:unnamed protein product [Dicrocoelium dendriticum]
MSVPHPSNVSDPTTDNPRFIHPLPEHMIKTHSGLSCASTEDGAKPKMEPVRSKSSFRLPGTKQHRKGRKSKVSHVTETDQTAATRDDGYNKQLTDYGVHFYPWTKTSNVRKAPNGMPKEPSGQGVLGKDARKSRRRIKYEFKMSAPTAYSRNTCSSAKPVFGVSLELALTRDPSHDGVPLPAFFRHCIDYIEEYGLGSEGIYRVPGVNSQVQSLLAAIDNGEEFPFINPTSATFYQQHQQTHGLANARATSGPFTLSGRDSIARHKLLHTGASDPKNLASAQRTRLGTDSRSGSAAVALTCPHRPHDPAVVASVVKYFLRNLPEPILTTRLLDSIESVPTDSSQAYHTIAKLVHSELPQSHRFLLAWMLQHITHIMDRSGENRMTLDNIIVVLSPCLRISHRLLAVLLRPAPSDLRIDLGELDPSVPSSETEVTKMDPSTTHWLFPHPIYLLRSYRPPLRPAPDLELPETDIELESELKKQESLLFHLHEQIGRGETTPVKEALLWETQRIVTELRRRKSLRDPETIRAELLRQQAQLDRLHRVIAAEATHSGASEHSDPTVSLQTPASSGMSPQSHRSSNENPSKRSINPIYAHPDELWEVQRQVTMLKRRLKQQEKLFSQQTNAQVPSSCASTIHGPIPLPIPTLSELDEEEVLNLTLRKLPAEIPCNAATAHDCAVPTQMSLPDATLENPPVTRLPVTDLSVRHHSPTINHRVIQLDLDPELSSPANLSHAMDIPDEGKMLSDHVEGVRSEAQDEPYIAPDREENLTTTVIPSQKFGHEDLIRRPNDVFICADPPTCSVSPWKTAESTIITSVPLTAAERQVAHQVAFYAVRKQELQAIQADLRARSWSENAEIRRIMACINHLLDTGGERIRQLCDAHFAPVHLSSGHLPALPNRSWIQIATRLNDDECWPDEKERSLPANGHTISESSDVASSTSTDSQIVTYSRLNDRDENCPGYSHESGKANELQVCNPDTHSADDDSEECEVELAKTLLQLTLDNARLEQLNARYLEGIQAERNRCAELKVLLKLRSSGRPIVINEDCTCTPGRDSQH